MVVAGEASGDQHAADLVAELHKRAIDARFFGMGGAHLAAQNVDLIYPATEVSVMGISEVFPKLRRILRVMLGLERSARRRRPDCAILVDIPDFNLRLARKLKRIGIPVVFFISPKVWAWRPSRIQEIADVADLMLCIFPFEEGLYRRAGVRTRYVGNPVLDQVPAMASPQQFRAQLGLDVAATTLALLPGSRLSEIQRILPAMVGAAKKLALQHPNLQSVIPIAPTVPRSAILACFRDSGFQPALIEGRAPEVIGAADVAVVASGTATLEAALMRRPLVVVYRLSGLTYAVGRLLVKVEHISLVNLLAGRRLVPELLQSQATPARIAAEVHRLLGSADAREDMFQGFDTLRGLLGPKGAAGRAAAEVLALLRA
jgi:lipid-A-disaccharide synthase